MSVAVQAILEGMPEPRDLRCHTHDNHTIVTVGSQIVSSYRENDIGMRNITVVTLTDLGFTGRRVAEVMGLTPEYTSMLRGRARKEGSAGLVRVRGRRPKLTPAQVERARTWHAEGLSDAQIARRLGVSNKTATRVLTDTTTPPDQPEPPLEQPGLEPEPEAAGGVEPTSEMTPGTEPEPGATNESGTGTARVTTGCFPSRYAGATLLHAFTDRIGAAGILDVTTTAGGPRRFDDLALLSATTTLFALGFASMEQAKHPDRSQVGPIVGIDTLPTLRVLRPRLASIADTSDPLTMQRALATAMLEADPNTSGVYFVDDHFVPYAGQLPVGKGWNTKRRHAERGRADTLICDLGGRAVCFTTGEPSGLTTTLPTALAELKTITGDAKLLLGFDRGGSYPCVFTACREARVDWITYRRGRLAPTGQTPVTATLTRDGTTTQVNLTDEPITINDYGTARQITLFENDEPVLQILTSDTTSAATDLIGFLRARWRIENLFKYLDFYGIDWLCDHTATITANTRPVDNPARLAAREHLKALTGERDDLRETLGALLTDRTLTIGALNRRSTTIQNKITKLERAITTAEATLRTIPAKLPANQVDPDAQRAIHRVARRALQMVCRLLAANAEHWLAHQLDAYLQDPNEYRAITRNLFHLGGTITYTPQAITVTLDRPPTPKIGRALALLLEQLNTTPPHIPGDPRPLTYTITPPDTE
jgi:transposase